MIYLTTSMQTPLYQKIANELIEKIEKGEFRSGDKLPTESELGRAYGVSRITVTHAIRVLQNRNLVFRVKGSGTFISKKKADGRGFGVRPYGDMSFISVIFPHGEQNGAHEILIGIESECTNGSYYVTIHNSRNKPFIEHEIIMNVLGQGCGGVIVYPCLSDPHNLDLYSELVIRDIPFVFIDRQVDFLRVPFVACDNRKAMRELVEHIISKGHRRIGFLYNSFETVSSERSRFKGYCEAQIGGGISVDPALLYSTTQSAVEDSDEEELVSRRRGEAALSHFMSLENRPTCIVAVNDVLAIALLKTALAAGVRVPEDLSITGFDDLPAAAHVEVPLTTVRQPFEQIGVEAARLLLGRIKGNMTAAQEILVPASIVVRESVK
jgi:GntR family transcriptional regulator, arabinose operon transcriptional repressor